MSSASLNKTTDGINAALMASLKRIKLASAYADTVIWPQYQKAQIERWQTENSSQGDTWRALTPEYKKRKKKKFATYPGAGNATMVATGRLAEGAQGRNPSYFMKLITDQTFTIAINTGSLPYAVYPGAVRPYMEFSEETVREWTDGLAKYLMKGKKP